MTPGEGPRWRRVYDILKTKDVGDVLTYEEILRALDMDQDTDREKLRGPLYRAAKEYLRFDKHDMEIIPNVGYRIVDPEGHLRNASRQQQRSYRALVRGRDRVVHVDLTGVDLETRKAFETIAVGFSRQMDFNRKMDIRQQQLEESLQDVSVRLNESDEELSELRTRLERLEKNQAGRPATEDPDNPAG